MLDSFALLLQIQSEFAKHRLGHDEDENRYYLYSRFDY